MACLGLAAILLPLASVPAQQNTQTFHDRMLDWERQTGKRSRLTPISKVQKMNLYPVSSPFSEGGKPVDEVIQNALDNPYQVPLNALANWAKSYQSAFQVLNEAWTADSFETFTILPSDPIFPRATVDSVGRVMACRAQAFAFAGNTDAALADLFTVWMVGGSLEAANMPWELYVTGAKTREVATFQIMALIEHTPLTQDQYIKMVKALTSQKYPDVDIHSMLLRDLEVMSTQTKEYLPAEVVLVNQMTEELAPMLSRMGRGSYAEEREAYIDYEKRARELMDRFSDPNKVLYPSGGVYMIYKTLADAQENVIITFACTVVANNIYKGTATPEQIKTIAGPNAHRLIDPFTGEPLKIINNGGDRVLVVSTGRDLKFNDGPMMHDRTSVLNSKSDIFIQRR